MRFNLINFTPFHHCFGMAVNGNPTVLATITSLFFSCGPSTVARFVMSIVVNSVEGVIGGWTASYSTKKFLKRTEAKTDASASITLISFCRGVIASGFGIYVASIFRSTIVSPCCLTMGFVICTSYFCIKTAARFDLFMGQVSRTYRCPLTARAATEPCNNPLRFFVKDAENSQAVETPPRQIFTFNVGTEGTKVYEG